jgi:myo-inositol-1(or 4)-monophosphatase
MNASIPPPDDLLRLRDFAQSLAREAAAAITQGLAQAHRVTEKAPGDWCSALDAAIEQELRARIAHTFPTHQFWGEESDAGEPTRLDPDRYTWLIDPIDGSMNFLRGYPQYAVSIALLQGSEPIVGCVMDPVRGECFAAALGLGAQVNGTPLRVAHTAQLAQAVAATVFPKPTAAWMDLYLAELGACLRGCAGARRAGSMALELAYLAAGRVDVFWARGMGAWDAAAGRLLIQEAGGAFWTLDGEPWWRSRAVAASAPGVETLWQNLLQDAAQTLK